MKLRMERNAKVQARINRNDCDVGESRMRIIIEDNVNLKPTIKTLFSGLKLNHPENIALVYLSLIHI